MGHIYLLKGISLIDTPGILSGEKHKTSRNYDFVDVIKWFAERAARILLLFDAHNIDISDELRQTIQAIKGT